MTTGAIILRAAGVADIPSINAIHRYYVENTVITFAKVPKSDEEALRSYNEITSRGYPYVVAVDESSNQVLGYTYVSGFRSGKAAYAQTVELSLFCRHDQTQKGIGSRLLNKLLGILREPEGHPDYIQSPKCSDARIRQVIACMAIDETAKKNGMGLKEFYERFGFETVGHLRQVGHKFDRWIDTIYLQLSLW